MSHSGLVGHWGDRLRELAEREGVPGAALGVWADGSEYLTAHGVLSAATGVPVTPDSLFHVGSITKLWTGTMIMQLTQEGRLSLDTTVAELLPGLRLGIPDASAEITIRHLLTHSSGIDGDIFTDTGRGGDCVERYANGLTSAARIFPPGRGYSYSNSGFVLLGRIIEVLDGREWDASLRERLIRPLGLAQTVTLPEEAILHRAAVGHRQYPNQRQPVSVWALPRSLGPAGLITASVHDVLTFARLHLDGGVAPDGTRLLNSELVTAMQQPQRPIPGLMSDRGDEIGLPWRMKRWSGGRRIIGHDGGTIGQAAFLRIDPQARVAVCLLTNSPEAERLFRRLFCEIFAEYAGVNGPDAPEPAAGPVHADLGQHAGRYERTSRRLDVTVRDERLHVVSSMTGDRAALDNNGPEEFTLHAADSTGNNFVFRRHDRQPWEPLIFGRLGDQTPYLYTGGRITPRTTERAVGPGPLGNRGYGGSGKPEKLIPTRPETA
jgi:CubicO group peptidase (beta-lactamase class C family)